jgi:hypothetical protein
MIGAGNGGGISMAKLLLTILLAFEAASVQAPPASTAAPIQAFVDLPEQRQALRSLVACLAEARPRWARQTLSYAYLSDAQARSAAAALSGKDSCLRGQDAELTFRTSSVVASLAEHFLRSEILKADFAKVKAALSTMPPLNASEDFALCVVARDPDAARDLALSNFGSEAETQALQQLVLNLKPCINQREQLTVDMQAIRALASIALYRGMTVALNTRN